MNTQNIFILIGIIVVIALASMSIQCYNQNEEFKKNNMSNFNFAGLILGLAVIVLAGGLVYMVRQNYGGQKQKIQEMYKKYYKNPQVNAQV